MNQRRNDPPELGECALVRRSRLEQRDDGWYFRTREGIAVGPYPTDFDAELSASLLVARLAQLGPQENAGMAIHAFLRDPNHGPPRPITAPLRPAGGRDGSRADSGAARQFWRSMRQGFARSLS